MPAKYPKRFYDPARADKLLIPFLTKMRAWQFWHLLILLRSHFKELAPEECKHWKAYCNYAILDHLERLRKFWVQETVNHYTVREVEELHYFDSLTCGKAPLDKLAEVLYDDWKDSFHRKDSKVYFNRESHEAVKGNVGRNGCECYSAQLGLSTIYTLVHEHASWKTLELPDNQTCFNNEYVGDAEIQLKEGSTRICSPYIPEHWNGVKPVTEFLEGMVERLGGKRFILFSPFNFEKGIRKHGSLPWTTNGSPPWST